MSDPGSAYSNQPPTERTAAEIAGRLRVLSVTQLRALGADKFWVARQVKGWLVPEHRGVYSIGGNLTREGRYLAAVLACGARSVLYRKTAADLWGVRPHNGRIEVLPIGGRAQPKGMLVCRPRRIPPEDVTEIRGIPTPPSPAPCSTWQRPSPATTSTAPWNEPSIRTSSASTR